MRFNRMDSMYADQLDFVPRERRNRVFRVIAAFAVTIALIFIREAQRCLRWVVGHGYARGRLVSVPVAPTILPCALRTASW